MPRSPIDAERLSAYERYELPLVGEPEEGPAEVGPPRALGTSQLQALRRETRDEAYRAGFEQGRAEGAAAGREQGLAEVRPALGALAAGAAELARPFAELDEEVERDLVQLALAVARQVVLHELSVHPEVVLGCVREALGALPSAGRSVRVDLNPEDLALVRASLAAEPPAAAPAWELREDPALARGGCRVHTESSHVDASLETRLERVIAHVLGGPRDGLDPG